MEKLGNRLRVTVSLWTSRHGSPEQSRPALIGCERLTLWTLHSLDNQEDQGPRANSSEEHKSWSFGNSALVQGSPTPGLRTAPLFVAC